MYCHLDSQFSFNLHVWFSFNLNVSFNLYVLYKDSYLLFLIPCSALFLSLLGISYVWREVNLSVLLYVCWSLFLMCIIEREIGRDLQSLVALQRSVVTGYPNTWAVSFCFLTLCIHRELELEVEPGLLTRHSARECGNLKCVLTAVVDGCPCFCLWSLVS